MNNSITPQSAMTRRRLLGAASLGAGMLAGGSTLTANPQTKSKEQEPNDRPFARIDGTGHGWVELGKDDFTKVNSDDDTWSWRDGVLYCTGQPISVIRSVKTYTNLEIVFEWNHRKPGGNSGLFVWADEDKLDQLTKEGKPGLPNGIEVQVLDPAYNPAAQGTWFTCHGDVFPVGHTMDPFPPVPKDNPGHRSFPSEDRVKPSGQWNHYYVRAINGEVRLWVNGKEVSGGNNCSTKTGYICLESEGSPIEFRNLHIRELP